MIVYVWGYAVGMCLFIKLRMHVAIVSGRRPQWLLNCLWSAVPKASKSHN